MNRSSKLSVLVALALGSAPALALTLGQIQVKSALDRPLVAVIPLHEDFPGEANHLTVTLAPDAAFTRAGINRANIKVPLTFTVTTNAKGQKVIRVTSTEPVREPYLDFLVQVTWPKGKLLREYVVLLDPLSMSAAPAVVPATAAPAAAPTVQRQQQAVQPPAPPPAAAAPAAAAGANGRVYGPVKPGDTLSRIAQANTIQGVSYQQMLLALKTTNRDAFFRNNVNALKAGAILRIPTRTQALAVTATAADAAIRKENAAWRANQPTTPTLVATAGGSSRPVNAAGKSASSSDRLKLVPPSAGAHGAGGSGAQATVSQLRQDLARNQEALSSQKQEAADLQSRVASLQKIADQNKRLLGLKNAQIAELQQKLAQTRKAAGLPAAPPSAPLVAARTGVAGAGSTATATPAVTGASTKSTAALAAASTARTAAAAPTRASAKQAPPAHAKQTAGAGQHNATRPASARNAPAPAMPWYQQLWVKVVGAIIIILLLITWFSMRRRRGSGKQPKPSLADSFGDTPFGRDADATVASPIAPVPDDAPGTAPVYTVDDDGEDELLAQLSEHPDNVALHLELVSLYYARGDVEQFEAAAEAMHPCVVDDDDPEWQEVVAMGRELAPDHPWFAGAAAHGMTDTLGRSADALATDDDWRAGSTPGESDTPVEAYVFEEPPESPTRDVPEFGAPATSLPDEAEFDALPPIPGAENASSATSEQDTEADTFDEDAEPTRFDEDAEPTAFEDDEEPALSAEDRDFASSLAPDAVVSGGFTDDPVDTKLDLARAYMDMGDHDGAQAMLVEAIHEGSQVQKEMAQKLLDELG